MLAHAVDYGPFGPVDYAPDGAVDYVAPPLWISQPCGLGRIYLRLTVLWISGLERRWGGEVGAGFAPTPPRLD